MENNNEQNQEQPAASAGAGDKSAAASILDRADALRKGLEEQNQKSEELLKQHQELLAKQILGGRSDAGQQPIPVKEETPQEYAKRLINGKF